MDIRKEKGLEHGGTAFSLQDYVVQWRTLHEVELELSRAGTFDALCRMAVELGHARLGFERLSLWFFTGEPDILRGTYGIDESGHLRDEHHVALHGSEERFKEPFSNHNPILFLDHHPLGDINGNFLKYGQSLTVALWNGEQVTGFIFYDNLLSGEPVTDQIQELLVSYGNSIGHLSTLKRAEEALRESEERWKFALESSESGVWDYDIVNQRIYFSPQWHLIMGYEPGECTSAQQFIYELIHPEDCFTVLRAIARHRRGQISMYSCEYRVKCRNGSYKWIHDRGKIIAWTPDGKPARFIGTHTDITGRKRLEEQYAQAQKMESIGRLAGGVAHDFNNLLTAILGHAELAGMKLPPEHVAVEDLTHIRQAVDRAAGLVRQLLAYARKQMISPQVIDLNTLAKNMESMLQRLIGENIELTCDLSPNLWLVSADAHQIEQVIVNLAVNARDAMPGGGSLRISTRNVKLDGEKPLYQEMPVPGDYAVLSVADTGQGIAPEIIERVFEPFFSTKEVGKGTGLGLATCMGIVKQSGGYVDVQSIKDKGTVFTVYLPRFHHIAIAAAPAAVVLSPQNRKSASADEI